MSRNFIYLARYLEIFIKKACIRHKKMVKCMLGKNAVLPHKTYVRREDSRMAENKGTKKETAVNDTPKKDKPSKKNGARKVSFKLPDGMHRAMPIVLFAVAVFTGVCFIIGDIGTFGNFLSDLLLGLFSYAAYAIPVLIALHAVFYMSDLKQKRILSRIIFSSVAISAIAAAIYTVENWREDVGFLGWDYYTLGISHEGGGLIGGLLGYCLTHLFGFVGMIIIALMVLAIYFTYFFSGGKSTLKHIGYRILKWSVTLLAECEKKIKHFFRAPVRAKERTEQRKINEKNRELYDDDFFDVDNGIEKLEITELGISEHRSRESIEARPALHEKVFHKSEAPKNESAKFQKGTYVYDGFEDNKAVCENSESHYRYEDESSSASDASADAVFTKSFDPFDIAISAELASKTSSRTYKENPTVTEDINEITEEELERARRTAEFERRKAELAKEAREREAERIARQATVQEPEYTYEKKTVEFNETIDGDNREPEIEDSFTATFDKTEEKVPVYSHDYSEEDSGELTRRHIDVYEENVAKEENEPISLFNFDTDGEPETLTTQRTMLGGTDEEYEDEEEESEELDFTAETDEDDLAEDEEIPPERQNPAINEYRDMFTMFRNEPVAEEKDEEPFDEPSEAEENSEEDNERPPFGFEEGPFPFEPASTKPEPSTRPEPKTAPQSSTGSTAKKADFSRYKMPPIDLLGLDPIQNDDEISAEINQNTNTLIETLASFNVTASIKGVDRGPRITRYEVVPARGVKVNAITNLFDDIALNLAAEGIRMEAPIPGKSAIGFEIPNKRPSNVRLRELLECEEFINAKSKTFVCIGKDVAGNPVFGDIAKFPHALVAGATGMGKSVCINSIMISMLYKARPDEVKFIMIDPKKVEFRMYSGIPHLLIPVITEAKQAAGALMWAVEEMERRYSIIEQLNIRNIETYNERCAIDKSIGEPMPKIVIVIDELNDLMMQVRDPVEDLIMRIAQKARAAGIHLIIGTQRPDVKVVTGTIKANINTRISCKVTSVVDSRTILEMAGAEKLLNRGDMLFKPVDKTKPIRVQGCFVSDPEVEAIMDFLKAECDGNIYDDEVFAEINRAAQKCGNKKSRDGDDDMGDGDSDVGYYSDQQFLDAVELAIRSGKVSTSLLQRKLSIGYGKAAKYIDAMEEIGIVSEQNGQKPRDVLLSMDEWHEKLTRVNFDE